MRKLYRNRQVNRKANGYLITEFGPALFLLFIGLFLPLLDLINIGFIYSCGYTLNTLQARQCATVTKSEAMDPAGLVLYGIPQQWKNCGLGLFAKSDGFPQTAISYTSGATETSGVQDMNVTVSTTITAKPFVTVFFFPGVPGLTAPMTFQYVSARVLENPNDANH